MLIWLTYPNHHRYPLLYWYTDFLCNHRSNTLFCWSILAIMIRLVSLISRLVSLRIILLLFTSTLWIFIRSSRCWVFRISTIIRFTGLFCIAGSSIAWIRLVLSSSCALGLMLFSLVDGLYVDHSAKSTSLNSI